MPRLTGRAGFAVAFLATALSVTWAGTSVLARLTDSASAGANTFTTPASFCTTRTLTATADTWTFEHSPNEPFGGTTLLVRADRGNDKYTWVNFALPTVPSGCSITSSTLKLTTITGTSGRTLEAWRSAAAWTESGLWSNQPPTAGTAATASSSATADDVISWDVLTQVQAMYPSSQFGFRVMDANWGTAEQSYHSRESTSTNKRPTLDVVIG